MSTLLPRVTSDSAHLAAEIHDELQSHLDETAAALIEEGWPEEAAWAEAHRRFGDLRSITKSCTRERTPRKTMLQKVNLLLIIALVAGVATLTVRASQAAQLHDLEIAELHTAIEALQLAQPAVAAPVIAAVGDKVEELLPPPSVEAEVAAFEALGTTPWSPEFRQAVRNWLENKPSAAPKLVAFGEEAIPVFVAVMNGKLKGRLNHIRFAAANHLGETKSAAAFQPLIDALEDPWFNVRRCAALALGNLGNRDAIGPLKELASSDPYVYHGNKESGPLALVRIDAEKALAMFN